jgi:2-desacetyl-2-hydroxyethyl bacteriochlorophyllide A dehydrogenase
MKSLVCVNPGEFAYKEIEMPKPAAGQAILRVKKIGICGTDLHAFEGTQPFFSYPRVLGHELALEVVEAAGFNKGDAVTIMPYFNCGTCIACRNGKPNCCTAINVFGVHIDGGMKEFISVPLYTLVDGEGLGSDELALIEPLAIGAHGVQRAGVTEGEFVLVIGAGPIGLGIMEFARIAGGKVIALDINQQRLDFCSEKLGVPYTINGTTENIAERLKEITNGDMATVVIDATGNLKAINAGIQYMAHGARFVLVGLQKEAFQFSHPEFHKRESTLMSSRNATRADFELVIRCIKSGAVQPANYITHRVRFDEVATQFKSWLDPANGVIKAVIDMN